MKYAICFDLRFTQYLSASLIPCFFGFCVDGRTYILICRYGPQSKSTNGNLVTYIPDLLRNLFRHLPVLFHIHTIIMAYFVKCLSVDGNYHTAPFRYHMSTSYIFHLQCQTSNDLSNVLQSIMSVFDQMM